MIMSERLLVVDKNDEIIRLDTRENCHSGNGILHRAFSIYIFNNNGQLLIQRRSKFKKLWPLYWSNSCCGHPREDENYVRAGERRLEEELGFTCPLKMVDKFQYQARYKDIGLESEVCAILVGEYNGNVKPNSTEIADWKWVDVGRVKNDFKNNPSKYAPWFKIGLRKYLNKNKADEKMKNELNVILEKTARIVTPVIQELLISHVDKKFQKLVNYQISTGGKRLRPTLAIISCKLFGGKIKDILYPAAGLEILHNCTLIIDDIIDHSNLRRGEPTTWYKFGKSIAECVGINYAAAVFEAANYSKKPVEISEIFAQTLKKIMVNGEVLDILFEQKGREKEPYVVMNRYQKISRKDYYDMVSKKTATLFQACCKVGAICAGATEKQAKILKNYGFNLGIAFQIQDDLLGIFGEQEKFGKEIGKDIEERKLGNIVLLFALKELSQKEGRKILKIIRQKEIENRDIKEVIKLIEKTNIYQKSFRLAESFIKKAKESLKPLPQNKWSRILEEFADFVIQRQN
jgi:geranylgeranyl diphosphate synthase type I